MALIVGGALNTNSLTQLAALEFNFDFANILICLLKIWKNGSFRNKENLQYKKTADSVLLSLVMRTNGKCNNSHAL